MRRLTLAWLREEAPCFFRYVLCTLTHSSMKAFRDCGFLALSWDEPELELDESLFLSLPFKNCERQQPMIRLPAQFTNCNTYLILVSSAFNCKLKRNWRQNRRSETNCTVSESYLNERKKNRRLSLECRLSKALSIKTSRRRNSRQELHHNDAYLYKYIDTVSNVHISKWNAACL